MKDTDLKESSADMIHQSPRLYPLYTRLPLQSRLVPRFSGLGPKNASKHPSARRLFLLTLLTQLMYPGWLVQATEGEVLPTVKDTAKMSKEAQQALLNRLNSNKNKRLEAILAILIKSPKGRFLMAEAVRKNPSLTVSLTGEAARRQNVVAATADDGSWIDIDGTLSLFPTEIPSAGEIDRQTRVEKQLTEACKGTIRLLATIAHELLHAVTLNDQNSIREEAKANKLAIEICQECFPFLAGNAIAPILAQPNEKELEKLHFYKTLPADNNIETYLKQTGLLK